MATKGKLEMDMNVQTQPFAYSSFYLLKRWKRYNAYSKSGSWNRTDSPLENLYTTSSVYLYDFVIVSENFWNSMVYTASVVDDTPGGDGNVATKQWTHYENTFRNTPNLTTNNCILTGSYSTTPGDPTPLHYNQYIFIDNGEYFEIFGGYPRNHYTHKRSLFSLYNVKTYGKQHGVITSGSYKRCQQTLDTTVGEDGLGDGSSPIQSAQVGNLYLIQGENVIN